MSTTSLAPPDGHVAAATSVPDTVVADTLDHRLTVFGDLSRWATLALGIVAGLVTAPIDVTFLTVASAFLLHAWIQHHHPVRLDPPGSRAGVRVSLELVLVALGVAATGGTHSPFVLTPMTVMVLAGYVWGERVTRG